MRNPRRVSERVVRVVDRAKQPGGLRHLASAAAQRVSPGAATQDEPPTDAAAPAAEETVRLAYEAVLRREPSAEELAAGVEALDGDGNARAAFFDGLGSRFEELPLPVVLRLGYLIMIRREPDPEGAAWVHGQFESGGFDRYGFIDWLRGTGDFVALGSTRLGGTIHTSRCQFVRTLPPAKTILDLGGTDLGHAEGAFVSMGYPYDFDELVIVDLPPDDRHELYQRPANEGTVQTPRGPVRYEYHSMTDLSRYADASFDLVYSGQTFEHVTEAEGDDVLRQVRRVLKPGGTFALDTPNATVCRLQQEAFIDPDHKIEYTRAQLDEKLTAAGFEITATYGLVWGGEPVIDGTFSEREAARHEGLFADVEHCYLLAHVCRSA